MNEKPEMTWAIPTPEEQVQFLRNIQRLLTEGNFVASYKYALIRALADLAVEKGDDSGAPLKIGTSEIAAKFIELYWRQSRPFQVRGETTNLVLQQNTGFQAEIISHIVKARGKCDGSLFQLKQTASVGWSPLVAKVNRVVCDQPLWKLQKIGKEELNFLYEHSDQVDGITLKPGVAFCFRAFYELVRDLIEAAWVRFVQKLNAQMLGNITDDLGTFLFGNGRTSLEAYRPILREVQRGECLYCGKPLSDNSHVDHFIPWSRYPANLGQNFILAHDKCNNAKSDFLAAEEHLAAWVKRNNEHQDDLQRLLVSASLPCDLNASVQIAKWAYEQTATAKGQVWVENKVLRHLGPNWLTCFSA